MHIQEILNAIYANHHYEYLVVDDALKVIEFSDRALALCDTKEIDCKRLHLLDAVYELYGLEREIEEIFRGERKEFVLSYVFKNDGEYVHIKLSPGRKRAVRSENGYLYESMIVLFENVTEIADMQQGIIQERNEKELLLKTISEKNEQLQRFNEEMQALVKEEIKKNLEKQKMVELQGRYSQMGEMIGMITHQWKQPLNVISIVQYVLSQKIENNEYSEAFFMDKLSIIGQQVKFMHQTVQDFQDFFNPTLEKVCFNVYDTLTFVVELMKYDYEYHNIELILEGKEGIYAYGYPNELNQVVISLLKNSKDAFLANPKANMRIYLKLDRTNEHTRIRVEDNAGGIPENVIDTIFDLYVTTKQEGSGLGLNIAKNVIENNMGGELTAENTESGARFTILLPSCQK